MNKLAFTLVVAALAACNKDHGATTTTSATSSATAPQPGTETATCRPIEPNNIVSIAMETKDLSTLVKALQAADYVDSIATPGPFTVFAPTNEAFDKLPKGTVENLMKPENKDKLTNLLKYHVAVSTYQLKDIKDGQRLAMANGEYVTFHVKDGKVKINDATVLSSHPATNGIVHVIDTVLLPPK